jgi:cytochrome c-type biogenesis protein CcmH
VTLPKNSRYAVAIAAAALVAMAAGLLAWGDAGSRPASDAAEPATTQGASRAELAAHLERSPRDARAWVLLARIDFGADRYADAAASYERALAASPKVAADPSVWCEYADALGMAQGGSLAGKPRELVMRALAIDPSHPKALEMAGSAAYEAGEYASAAGYWRQLAPRLVPGSRPRAELEAAIARVDAIAGSAALASTAEGLRP